MAATRQGRKIISSEADCPSVAYSWHRIAEDTGCEVRLVGVLGEPGSFDVSKIAEKRGPVHRADLH